MSVDTVTASPATQIANAIGRAVRSTGASFECLHTTAQIESSLDPAAQAPTSSTKGLFQFIEQTWLGTLKQADRALGLDNYADTIVPTAMGATLCRIRPHARRSCVCATTRPRAP